MVHTAGDTFFTTRLRPRAQPNLINALTKHEAWARQQSSLSEEFTNYEGDLIAAVTSLNDPRAIDVLFTRIDSGNMALNALAGFGDDSLAKALSLWGGSTDDRIRRSALMLLAKLVEPANAAHLKDPASRPRLLAALSTALKRNDYFARSSAIHGLEELGDRSAVSALNEVAASEPTGSPVREQAMAAIGKLSRR